MNYRLEWLVYCAWLMALASSALGAQIEHAPRRSSGDVEFEYGLVPAAVVARHAKDHAERQMHGGAPARSSTHLVDALFDRQSGARVSDAEAVTYSDRQPAAEHFARLRHQFNDDAIIELTALIAFQNLSSKFNAALGVEAQGFCAVAPQPLRPQDPPDARATHASCTSAASAVAAAQCHQELVCDAASESAERLRQFERTLKGGHQRECDRDSAGPG